MARRCSGFSGPWPRFARAGGRALALYRFRHALFRRWIYDGLDEGERRLGHERAASAIEAVYAEARGEADTLLARHYAASGRPLRAAPYLVVAAERSGLLGAPEEALASYDAALAVLDGVAPSPETDGLRRRVLEGRVRVAGLAGGFACDAVGDAIRRVRGECAATGDEAGIVRALLLLASHLGARGDSDGARLAAEEARARAEARSLRRERREAVALLGVSEAMGGDLRQALDHFEAADGLREAAAEGPPSGHDPAIVAGVWGSLALLLVGRATRAEARARETVAEARQRGNAYGAGLAMGFGLGMVLVVGRRAREAREIAGEVLARAETCGFPTLLAVGEFLRGAALAEGGDLEAGEAGLRRSIALLDASGHRSGRSLCLGRLAEVLVASDRGREALTTAEEAVRSAESCGERNFLPETLRIRAEAALSAGGDRREAVDGLRTALSAARERGTLLFELRCANALLGLGSRPGGGSRNPSRFMGQIRARFAEGFDLPDLRLSCSLLEGVGGCPA